ncbi:hypothetical protein ANO11243_057510 [Dothideomycetidae sp. 11243]|nr:hypothetical protein ANO11243_057510 [fungal sp. No.11243]
MRRVRRAVMQTYLNKAENDPNTTDVRVTRKRTGSRNKKTSSPVPPQTGLGSSATSAVESSSSRRKDSRIDESAYPVFDASESYPTPGASSESSRAHSIHSFNNSEELRMPTLSRPAPASHPSATSIPSFENAVLEDVLNKNNPGRQRAFTANSATRDVTHGESGVIPVHLSITDLEANFLRNEDADLLYLSFAEKYAGDASETTRSTLESPVFSRDPSLKAVASSPMCSIPTHRLLYLSLQLTERFLQLDRMKDIASTDVGSTAGEFGKDELEKIIYKISIDIHGLPASSTPGHRGYNDSVYESIRLATLLYCHAILHQVPVHKASGLRCMLDHGAGCMSNPDLIQQAICKTNLSDAWDRMAGVLYWVLLVAGAACHKDVKITASEHDLKAAVTRSQGQQRLSRAPSAGIKSEPPWSDNAFVQSQAFSTPESSGRIFQQYLSAQHLDTAKLATPPSFPGSQPTSRTQSPLPTHPHVGMQAPSMPHSKTTAVRSSSSSTPAPVSPRVEPSLAKLGKRVRTSSPPGLNEINHQISTADSINNSNQAEDKTFVRNFLVANAIRCSILLRFEHTGAVVGSIAKLGRVRNALNRDNHR